QTTKTTYVHPEVLVDTQWVEEHLEDKNVRVVESYLPVNKHYYNKKNFRFVLCDSCFWFVTILKNIFKVTQCPRCKKNKLYIDRIAIN
ncbi:MAG: hypothetical protein ACXWFC_07535, partial [Nitrososphaeraceae archaeon]